MNLPGYRDVIDGLCKGELSLPEDTVFSVPVAVMRGEYRYDALFAFRVEDAESKAPVVTRPFAWMMLPQGGGPDILYSWCRVLDFVPTESYPIDSAVSGALPKALSPRKILSLRDELLDNYEMLRQFAFEENLNRDQVDTIVRYKALFLRLCYSGLYPFYHALSPSFFHWLRMPLPEMKTVRIAAGQEPKEYQYQLLILENLKSLVDQFQQKIMVDSHKQQLFDEMHAELQQYRNGVLETLTLSMERDIIQMIDTLGRSLKVYEDQEGTPEGYRRLLAQFAGVRTDLQDLLYRHGVDPYHMPGNEVDVTRQKVIATLPTADRSLDRRIAARLSPGWEKNDRVIRREYISVYLHEEPAGQEAAEH